MVNSVISEISSRIQDSTFNMWRLHIPGESNKSNNEIVRSVIENCLLRRNFNDKKDIDEIFVLSKALDFNQPYEFVLYEMRKVIESFLPYCKKCLYYSNNFCASNNVPVNAISCGRNCFQKRM